MSDMFIYGLIDPVTMMIRYIGLATNKRRPHQHRYYRDDSYKTRWIRSLAEDDLSYEICVLENCVSVGALKQAERWWIAYGRASNWPLTNLTDGGESTSGLQHTDDFKRALSDRMIGNTYAVGGRGGVISKQCRQAAKLAQFDIMRSDERGRK